MYIHKIYSGKIHNFLNLCDFNSITEENNKQSESTENLNNVNFAILRKNPEKIKEYKIKISKDLKLKLNPNFFQKKSIQSIKKINLNIKKRRPYSKPHTRTHLNIASLSRHKHNNQNNKFSRIKEIILYKKDKKLKADEEAYSEIKPLYTHETSPTTPSIKEEIKHKNKSLHNNSFNYNENKEIKINFKSSINQKSSKKSFFKIPKSSSGNISKRKLNNLNNEENNKSININNFKIIKDLFETISENHKTITKKLNNNNSMKNGNKKMENIGRLYNNNYSTESLSKFNFGSNEYDYDLNEYDFGSKKTTKNNNEFISYKPKNYIPLKNQNINSMSHLNTDISKNKNLQLYEYSNKNNKKINKKLNSSSNLLKKTKKILDITDNFINSNINLVSCENKKKYYQKQNKENIIPNSLKKNINSLNKSVVRNKTLVTSYTNVVGHNDISKIKNNKDFRPVKVFIENLTNIANNYFSPGNNLKKKNMLIDLPNTNDKIIISDFKYRRLFVNDNREKYNNTLTYKDFYNYKRLKENNNCKYNYNNVIKEYNAMKQNNEISKNMKMKEMKTSSFIKEITINYNNK